MSGAFLSDSQSTAINDLQSQMETLSSHWDASAGLKFKLLQNHANWNRYIDQTNQAILSRFGPYFCELKKILGPDSIWEIHFCDIHPINFFALWDWLMPKPRSTESWKKLGQTLQKQLDHYFYFSLPAIPFSTLPFEFQLGAKKEIAGEASSVLFKLPAVHLAQSGENLETNPLPLLPITPPALPISTADPVATPNFFSFALPPAAAKKSSVLSKVPRWIQYIFNLSHASPEVLKVIRNFTRRRRATEFMHLFGRLMGSAKTDQEIQTYLTESYHHLEIRKIPNDDPRKGLRNQFGLFVKEGEFPAGSVIAVYGGELVLKSQTDPANAYIFELPNCDLCIQPQVSKVSEASEASKDLYWAHYINDASTYGVFKDPTGPQYKANCEFKFYCPPNALFGAIVAVAKREIHAGEEVLAPYGEGYWKAVQKNLSLSEEEEEENEEQTEDTLSPPFTESTTPIATHSLKRPRSPKRSSSPVINLTQDSR